MLKSLEKLRNGISVTFHADAIADEIRHEIADEIQADVDKFYLPRPLFEDGEPVQVGDYVDLQREGMRCVQVTGIEPWIVYGDSTSHQKEPYKRPPEPDTQEKIDADALLFPVDYLQKYNLSWDDSDTTQRKAIVMRRHLLARQRKLDGAE